MFALLEASGGSAHYHVKAKSRVIELLLALVKDPRVTRKLPWMLVKWVSKGYKDLDCE